MATRVRIPPELVDHICSYLYYERPTLFACSLIATSWTDAARRRLFSKLTYGQEKWGMASFPSLLQFLQATPSVSRHVRTLKLKGADRDGDEFGVDTRAHWDQLDPKTFAGLVAILPKLRKVVMSTLALIPSPDGDSLATLTSAVPSKPLDRLTISSIHIEGETPCSTFLQFFPPLSSIRDIILYDATSTCDAQNASEIRNICKTLDLPVDLGIQNLTLALSAHLAFMLLEVVRKDTTDSLRYLHYLFWECDIDDQVSLIEEFLHDEGRTIENLEIHLTGSDTEPPDLSQCVSLQTLTFIFEFTPDEADDLCFCVDDSIWSLQFAPEIPFKLCFKFDGGFHDRDARDFLYIMSSFRWEWLVDTASCHPFREQKVTFIILGGYDGLLENIEHVIRAELPDLDKEGLLEFELGNFFLSEADALRTESDDYLYPDDDIDYELLREAVAWNSFFNLDLE